MFVYHRVSCLSYIYIHIWFLLADSIYSKWKYLRKHLTIINLYTERPFIHKTHDRMVHISNDRTRQRSDHRTLLHGRQLARRFVWLLLCVMTSMRHAQMTNQKRKKNKTTTHKRIEIDRSRMKRKRCQTNSWFV